MSYVFSMVEDDRYENDVDVTISIDESIIRLTMATNKTQYYVVKPSELRKLYKFLQENQDLLVEPEVEEKNIPVTYATIKNTVGWSKFCDVTENNCYAINEFGDFDLNEIFYITQSQFKELW